MQRVSTVCSPRHRVAIAAFVATLALASPLLRAQRATAPAPPTPAATPTATLDRVRAAARIRLGYRDDARPFSYRESGQPAGYAVALCQKIADAVKAEPGLGTVTVEWVPVTVETRLTAVQQGDIDLFCGPEPITLAARRDVSFSIPVFPGGVGALLRADAPARLREALSGTTAATTPIWRGNAAQFLQARTYAVVAGTPTEQWLAGRTRELGIVAKVSTVTSNDAGVTAVVARTSDVFFAERSILLDAAKRSGSAGALLVLDRMFTVSPLALAFRRGDDDFGLIVDRTLSGLYSSGEIGNLYTAALGEPDANTLTFFRWNTLPE